MQDNLSTEGASQMQVTTEILDEIVKRVLTVTAPDAIILFGSAAKGAWNEDSDIDLLILEHDP